MLLCINMDNCMHRFCEQITFLWTKPEFYAKRCIFCHYFNSWNLRQLFMITFWFYSHFVLNIGHYYLIFSQNISFLIPTLSSPSPSFFTDLVPDVINRKIAATFFHYMESFKLNLKLGCCSSILGLAINRKRFK